MNLLELIQRDYLLIDKAGTEFVNSLSGNNIKRDITLAAEMAGLQLLRATRVDFSKSNPGTILLGAISDETFSQMWRFISVWVSSNGLNRKSLDAGFNLPDSDSNYLPEITQLETSFEEICHKNNIKLECYPFVAATAAMRLVLAGNELKLLDQKIGIDMVFYHIIAGSKTVPYPFHPEN
jgi:hypothetical protein